MMITVVNFYTVGTYAAKIDKKAKITLQSANQPTKITKGKSYTVKGKMVSNKKMKRVEIGIVYAKSNKWTKYKYDKKKVNAKTFNIGKAASKLKFQKLAVGTYYYRMYAHTKDGVVIVLNKKFTVVKPPAATTTTTTTNNSSSSSSANSSAANTSTTATQTTTSSSQGGGLIETILDILNGSDKEDNIKLSNYNFPIKYNVGSKYTVKGKITSDNPIKRIEAGIVVTATNKWTEYKYDNKAVNAKSFDLSNVASTLKFEELPGGTFTYRIYAHTQNGVTTVLNKSFTVNPSNKANGAIKWATAIAADDKYTYGKGYGGYFTCCVCAKKTENKEDTKFTCMPFLAAAYAHGTGDSSLMNGGRHIMNLNDDNFKGTLGKAWFKVGLCKDLSIEDLQPGDVIIKWSANNETGHSWMYGGGDKIIEAVPADIRVLNSGAAAKLRRYGTSEGTPSKNYVMRYRK